MGVEIERKFLVDDDQWRKAIEKTYVIRQGYLSTEADRTIRVRIKGSRGFLTVKGQAQGLVRREFEYEIPLDDARTMLEVFCVGRSLEKVRHEVKVGDHIWEVDVFEGPNSGLVVAEVELGRPDEQFIRPPWVGKEVTGEVNYYNARLVANPYKNWNQN